MIECVRFPGMVLSSAQTGMLTRQFGQEAWDQLEFEHTHKDTIHTFSMINKGMAMLTA